MLAIRNAYGVGYHYWSTSTHCLLTRFSNYKYSAKLVSAVLVIVGATTTAQTS